LRAVWWVRHHEEKADMQIRNALLAATILALPLAAQAQPVTGLYIGGGAGVNIMQNEDLTFSDGGKGHLAFSPGAAAVLSLGWGFGNGLRAEVEGDYRWNTINHAGSNDEQKYGPMVNVLYDFTTISPMVVPYAGVGVGYQWANITDFGTKGSFAYQAILGAAIPIPAVPGLAVTGEYRFMGLAGNRDYDGGATASNEFNHSILIGLRYAFWAPAPPPPAPAPMAAPAPAPARSYLVFFDWDKANLTPRAQQIIREAADNSTKVKYTRIEVNGYTDTSGTPQYNQGLSIRRAQAVAAELVKDGVPQGAIAIQGFGETHLLVPTGPGVREPQNRRVEIIIR
jgi:OmpA-OmpF porin, OOP family